MLSTLPRTGQTRNRRHAARFVGTVALAALVGWTAACETNSDKTPVRAPASDVAPPPNYTGPSYLRGTVGSLVNLRPGSADPQLVSGFGVVVFPPGSGSGSPEVPAPIRQRLLGEMRKRGVGSARTLAHMPLQLRPFMTMSPEQLLDSGDVAVVVVQGLIPPGATKDTRFDVLVKPVSSQVTTLTGGTLWTTDLGIQGANTAVQFTRPLAEARGAIYINPISDVPIEERQEFQRNGVVVLGGAATSPRVIELVLNQPSWTRSRLIADRINERFGRSSDPEPVADPQTDVRIQLNVPERWATRPIELITLINHLFVERGPEFERLKAETLATVLRDNPESERYVASAWRSLGRPALQTLQSLYGDAELRIRIAALEAGAHLADERATRHLDELSRHEDPVIRARAADALVHLPSSLQGAQTLRRLLDDNDTRVRLAAYESLARINDRTILDRFPVGDGTEVKFLIDRLPSSKPLVYVTQEAVPRLVIFGEDLGFKTPMLARMWDNRLMLKAPAADQPLTLFYQPPRQIEAKKHQLYPHSVATLAYVLGHRPHDRDLQDGLDLSYTHVIDAVYQLCRDGWVDAPVEFRTSLLAQRVEELQKQPTYRPETGTNEQGVDLPGVPSMPATPDAPAIELEPAPVQPKEPVVAPGAEDLTAATARRERAQGTQK